MPAPRAVGCSAWRKELTEILRDRRTIADAGADAAAALPAADDRLRPVRPRRQGADEVSGRSTASASPRTTTRQAMSAPPAHGLRCRARDPAEAAGASRSCGSASTPSRASSTQAVERRGLRGRRPRRPTSPPRSDPRRRVEAALPRGLRRRPATRPATSRTRSPRPTPLEPAGRLSRRASPSRPAAASTWTGSRQARAAEERGGLQLAVFVPLVLILMTMTGRRLPRHRPDGRRARARHAGGADRRPGAARRACCSPSTSPW